ncbi:MAG TPA: hypothetical protein VIF02_06035 [Methylocella sp.]
MPKSTATAKFNRNNFGAQMLVATQSVLAAPSTVIFAASVP